MNSRVIQHKVLEITEPRCFVLQISTSLHQYLYLVISISRELDCKANKMSSKSILEQLQTILHEKFPFLRVELCWKAVTKYPSGRAPFLHISKPMQMPNLRFMTYLPSFHVIITVGPRPKDGILETETVTMHLLTFQGRVIAKETFEWEWISTPQFKLVSQLANDSIAHCRGITILKGTNEVKNFLRDAKHIPQPCYIEQMELKIVIRSLSCKFAVLVTSGLKIIPRCSECMSHASPHEFENEEVNPLNCNINNKLDNHGMDEEGECEQLTDEEGYSSTDDVTGEKKVSFNSSNVKATTSAELLEIKSESSSRYTESQNSSLKVNQSEYLPQSNSMFDEIIRNVTEGSHVSLVPENLSNLNKLALSVQQRQSEINQKCSANEHVGKSKLSFGSKEFDLSRKIDILDISSKLPNSVTVTKVPKVKNDNIDNNTSPSNRKNRDVIVTASGVVRDNTNFHSSNTVSPFHYKNSKSTTSLRPRKRSNITIRSSRRKFKQRGKIPRVSKKVGSYVKINETCKICLHHFTVKQAFERDQKWHEQKFDLTCGVTCPICQLYMEMKCELTDHFKNYHPELGTCCCECLQVMPSTDDTLRKHMLTKHELARRAVCPTCGKNVAESYLKVHIAEAHSDAKEAICHECGKAFATVHKLKIHLQHNHHPKVIPCPECGKMFGRQVMLLRHIRVHTSMKPYKCIQCDYKSYKGGNIVLHARKVHGRQGTVKDVVTLQEEKAAMDSMVETILKKGDLNSSFFQQIERSVADDNPNEERILENKNEVF